jgi:hypothetical protein
MTPAQRKAKDARIRAAMANLSGNPHFDAWMEYVGELREVAIREGLANDTVASERLNLVSKGYVRAYTELVDAYEESRVRSGEDEGETEGG